MAVNVYGQIYIGTTAPAEDPVQVGSIWADTTANLLKRCTSVGPYTWVSIEGGSVAHAIDAAVHTASGLTDGQVMKATGATAFTFEDDDFGFSVRFYNGGSVLATGIQQVAVEMPFAGVFESARMMCPAGETGSVVVDIWKDTYANLNPTVADTITAAAKPTIASGTKDEDATLTGWTTAFAKGDWLLFNIDSVTTFTLITLALAGRKT